MTTTTSSSADGDYQIEFCSLTHPEQTFVFPCSASGKVDLDALGSVDRINYFFARKMVGREVAAPLVIAARLH